MHIKTLLLSLLFSTTLFGASNGVYIELGAGLGLNDKLSTENGDFFYKRGIRSSLALGYQVNKYRLELEGKYVKESLSSFANVQSSGDLIQNSQMLNIYYSGYNSSNFVTSIGVGAGITNISTQNLSQNSISQKEIKSSTIPSFQGLFSIGYMINEHFTASTKYSYFYTTKSDELKADGENIFTFTLRYLF